MVFGHQRRQSVSVIITMLAESDNKPGLCDGGTCMVETATRSGDTDSKT